MSDYNFSTKTNDLDVWGFEQSLNLSGISFDIEQKDATIQWYVAPEIREWGIKSLDIFITKVKISFKWSVYSDGLTNDQLLKLISIGGKPNLNNSQWIDNTIEGYFEKTYEEGEFSLINNLELKEYGYLSPDNIEIDFIKKKIEVS
jgi:hypothetical protein